MYFFEVLVRHDAQSSVHRMTGRATLLAAGGDVVPEGYDINSNRINASFHAADRLRHRRFILLACIAWLLAVSRSAAAARAAIVVAAQGEERLSTLRCCAFGRDAFVVIAAELTGGDLPGDAGRSPAPQA